MTGPWALLEIFLLGVGSMFWPLLLVVVVLALRTDRPVKILCWFWAGGMLTCVSVGAALVFALQDSTFMSGDKLSSAPWVDIVVGTLALVAAVVLRRVGRRNARRRRPETARKERRSSEWIERMIESGGPLAFVGGIVATILPAPLAIIAMADVAQLGYSTGASLLVIVLFYVVMFTFVEVPIIGYAVSPEATAARVTSFNAWLARNLVQLGVSALTIFGAAEIVRGVVTALR